MEKRRKSFAKIRFLAAGDSHASCCEVDWMQALGRWRFTESEPEK